QLTTSQGTVTARYTSKKEPTPQVTALLGISTPWPRPLVSCRAMKPGGMPTANAVKSNHSRKVIVFPPLVEMCPQAAGNRNLPASYILAKFCYMALGLVRPPGDSRVDGIVIDHDHAVAVRRAVHDNAIRPPPVLPVIAGQTHKQDDQNQYLRCCHLQ